MTPILLDRITLFGIREPVSALSHGAGAVLGVIAMVVLIRRAARAGASMRARARMLLYGICLVLAFGASFLFHLFDRPPEEIVLYKKLDHAAIFLLIASTTAAIVGLFDRAWSSWMIRATWAVAVVGIVIKMTVWPMSLWMSATIYLLAGWFGAIGLILAARTAGWARLRPLLHGAILMSGAAFCFALEQPVLVSGVIEGHEVFHIGILAGMALFFVFIYRHCDGTLCDSSPMERAAEDLTTGNSVHPGVFREVR